MALDDAFATIPGDATLLLAVSGGADSIALLHLAAARVPRDRLAVGHFDHRLRAGSADDAAFVRDAARELGVSARIGVAPPGARLAAEGRARRARYRFLLRTARATGATHVATAHTRDDQAETVIDRIARGAGIRGLRGILPDRRLGAGVRLIRPLLDVRRDALRAWLSARELPWREDPTNADPRHRRNRIRAELLPALVTLGPGGTDAIARIADHAREAWELIRWEAQRRLARALTEDGGAVHLDRDALRRAPAAARWPMLAAWLRRAGHRPRGLGSRSIEEAVRLAIEGRTGARWERRGRAAFVVGRTRISASRRPPPHPPTAGPSDPA